eukprot:m.82789 g.82789  ORF g.82789 m.82789 type:complete len:252 (+) comp14934_c0_seq3:236-991(+)
MSERTISSLTLRRLQAGSGLTFGTFGTLHVANLYLAMFSQRSVDSVMTLLQQVYHRKEVECLGIAALATHAMCGFVLARRRGGSIVAEDDFRKTLHRVTGYILAGSVTLHVLHMRVYPHLSGKASDFLSVHYCIKSWPAVFYPAFGLLVVAGIYHQCYGIVRAITSLSPRPLKISSRRFNIAVCVLVSCGLLSVAGFGGLLYPVNTVRWKEVDQTFHELLGAVTTTPMQHLTSVFQQSKDLFTSLSSSLSR